MVTRVIACDVLQRIPWKCISAVVIHCLDRGESEEQHPLTWTQTCDFIADASTKCIQEEAFEWMVIQSSECVRDVQTMVPGVECRCNLALEPDIGWQVNQHLL